MPALPQLYIKFRISTVEAIKDLENLKTAMAKTGDTAKKVGKELQKVRRGMVENELFTSELEESQGKLSKALGRTSKAARDQGNALNYTATNAVFLIPVTQTLYEAYQKLTQQMKAAASGAVYMLTSSRSLGESLNLLTSYTGNLYEKATPEVISALAELRNAFEQTQGQVNEFEFKTLLDAISELSRTGVVKAEVLTSFLSAAVSTWNLSIKEATDLAYRLVASFATTGASLDAISRKTEQTALLLASLGNYSSKTIDLLALFADVLDKDAKEALQKLMSKMLDTEKGAKYLAEATKGAITPAEILSAVYDNLVFNFTNYVRQAQASSNAYRDANTAMVEATKNLIEYLKELGFKTDTAYKIANFIAVSYTRGGASLENFSKSVDEATIKLKGQIAQTLLISDAVSKLMNSIIALVGSIYGPFLNVISIGINFISTIINYINLWWASLDNNPFTKVIKKLISFNLGVATLILVLTKLGPILSAVTSQIPILGLLLARITPALNGFSVILNNVALGFFKVAIWATLILTLIGALITIVETLRGEFNKASKDAKQLTQNTAQLQLQMNKNQEAVQSIVSNLRKIDTKQLQRVWEELGKSNVAMSPALNLDETLKKLEKGFDTKLSLKLDESWDNIKSEILGFFSEPFRMIVSVADFGDKISEAYKAVQLDLAKFQVGRKLSVSKSEKKPADWVVSAFYEASADVQNKLKSKKKDISFTYLDKKIKELTKATKPEDITSKLLEMSKGKTKFQFIEELAKKTIEGYDKMDEETKNLVKDLIRYFLFLKYELVTFSIVPDMLKGMIAWFNKGYNTMTSLTKAFTDNIIESFNVLGDKLVFGSIVPDIVRSILKWLGFLKSQSVYTSEGIVNRTLDEFTRLYDIEGIYKDISSVQLSMSSVFGEAGAKLTLPSLTGPETTVKVGTLEESKENIWDKLTSAISTGWANITNPETWKNAGSTIVNTFNAQLSGLGEIFNNWFGKLTGNLSVQASNMFNTVLTFIQNPVAGFAQLIAEMVPIEEMFKNLLEGLTPYVKPIVEALAELFNTVAQGLTPVIQEAAEIFMEVIGILVQALAPVLTSLVPVIKAITGIFLQLFNLIKGPLIFAVKVLASLMIINIAIMSLVWNAIISVINFVLGLFGLPQLSYISIDVKSSLQKIWGAGQENEEGAKGGGGGGAQPVFMQKGGIITKPTNIIAGEAGPEAIIPLSKLSSLSSPRYVNIEINISGNNIASDYDVERIADKIIYELKLRGITA